MIKGNNKIELCDAAVLDALSRYLSAEFKEPVEATEFIRKADHYDKATIVTFKADESQAKVTP